MRARVRTHLFLVHIKELEKSQRDAIFMLAKAGHCNDTDTGVHIRRMAALRPPTGCAAAGWEQTQCDLLELAAPMHDTGKIGIPDAILRSGAGQHFGPSLIDAFEACLPLILEMKTTWDNRAE